MSQGVPIIETVCVQTEERVIGYREPDDREWAEIEAFSSGIPAPLTGAESFPVSAMPQFLPSGVLIPSPRVDSPAGEPPAIDAPSAVGLIATGAIALFLLIKNRWN